MDLNSVEIMMADFEKNLRASTPQSPKRTKSVIPDLQRTLYEDSGIGSLPSSPCITEETNDISVKYFSSSTKCHNKIECVETVRQTVTDITASLLPTPVHRLIGVNCGLPFVDFVSELSAKNQYQPLKQIFTQVDAADLCRMSMVCSKWKDVINKDFAAKDKRLNFLLQHAPIQKENSFRQKKVVTMRHSNAEPLSSIHNILDQPSVTSYASVNPTSSASVSFPFQLELAEHEKLQRCPNCMHPSRVSELYLRGVCTNTLCNFDYCIYCHAPYTQGHHCEKKLVSGTIVPSTLSSSAKRSRNNLRRL